MQWRYLSLFLCVSLEFHLLMRSTASPSFSFVFPSRLPYEHVALLRQIFISASMAMSQLAPLVSPPPPTPSGSPTGDEALAAALADAEQLRPLLQRLAALSSTTEREVAALQRLELRPLLPADSGGAGAGAGPGTDDVERQVRKDVEDSMVQVWEDLQVKGASGTARVWTEAVQRGRAREARTEEAASGSQEVAAAEKDDKPAAVAGDPAAKDAAHKPGGATDGDAVPTLEAAAIPPPVTALTSPPASPKLGFPLSSIDSSPIVPAIELTAADGDARPEKAEGGGLKAPRENAAHRLPTPPPED